MRFSENVNKVGRVLLIALVLSAVCPWGGYNSRLQLFSPTSVPTAANETIPSDAAIDWLTFLDDGSVVVNSEPAGRDQPSSQRLTVHVAASYFARASLEASDGEPQPRFNYEPYRYSSPSVSQPAERGPPPAA